MALADRKEGDAEELDRIRCFNSQQLEPHVVGTLAEANERVDELFTRNPALSNTLTRTLICDSQGQHKDRRNEKRLAGANIEDVEAQDITPITGRKTSTFDLY